MLLSGRRISGVSVPVKRGWASLARYERNVCPHVTLRLMEPFRLISTDTKLRAFAAPCLSRCTSRALRSTESSQTLCVKAATSLVEMVRAPAVHHSSIETEYYT
eukprot:6180004-Pleurochrysis_carterae.AAC.1